jgi:transcriptional regulator with XRE-family HTH domain
MSIGDNIKEFRKLEKLTQVELAKKSNISRSYLADIEKDRYNASVDTLKSIAKALNVSLNMILNDAKSREEKEHIFEQYLSSLDIKVIYDDKKMQLALNTSNDECIISADDLNTLQDNIDSYIKFKVSELINKLKIPSININTYIPVAAHNDFEDDEEQQKLMKEDLDEL